MNDIATDLKECFDDFAYSYLGAWEHDPQMVIENNTITGRDPAREDHENRMIEIFEKLRDTVDAIPPSIIAKTEESRESISSEKYESSVIEAIQNVGRTSLPKDATEFLESLNLSLQLVAQ